jgi:Predicted nucleotide-binding protein containing TIR-like domain
VRRSGTAFLHFFDLHFLVERGIDAARREVVQEATLATRIALLLCERVVVPAASYYESRLCEQIVDGLDPFFDDGRIRLAGGGSSLEEFRDDKLQQYTVGSSQDLGYRHRRTRRSPPFLSRDRSAGADIVVDWFVHAESGAVPRLLARNRELPPDIEQRWADVPQRLEGRAFVVEYVAPLLDPGLAHSLRFRNSLHAIINPAYFGSYQNDLRARVVTDLVWLAGAQLLGGTGPPIRYTTLRERLRNRGQLAELLLLDGVALRDAEQRERFSDALDPRRRGDDRGRPRGRHHRVPQALIVHGRGPRRYELRDLLGRWEIDADFLDQQQNLGRTLIEKFEQTAEQVEMAFVLVEPDDVGRLRQDGTDEQLRTRQNVIFEMGWFMGALGRLSGRVIVLEDRAHGPIEWLSDLDGLLRFSFVGSIESIAEALRRELDLD